MSKKNDWNLKEEKLEFHSLDNIMSDRFARYSKYIIQQRALPDVRDGLKPVQRRILFSMNELGLQFNKSYKKSARVVGDVIGKYHPHGDSSIYEALVRMAQDWKMNIPLVEMHGNKGSIDDDPAAAMRYTEAKLSKISSLMLDEIDKKTIQFAPNFDDTEKEPTVLPSYIPNLLLNGSRGIASGFATEIPPHNLNELLDGVIAKIRKPTIDHKALMKYIKGPDFPTGGIIYGTKGIEQAFETGQGRLVICSRYSIDKDGKNSVIRISEIPFSVVKSKLVRQIDEARFNGQIQGIKEVRDETDRNGISVAIVLEQGVDENLIVNLLMQKTDFKTYYNYNMVSIVNNTPRVLGIDKMIDSYLKHIKEVKKNAIAFDLAKNRKRLEIVNGFIRVSQIPDEVIRVIRESSDGKQGVIKNLQEILHFSEIQATAIAELRLYRLNRTDVSIYENEKLELEQKIKFLELIYSNEEEFNNYLIAMFKNIKKEYGIERRTSINEEELQSNVKVEEFIMSEPCWLTLSNDGYLKRFSNRIYEANEISNFSFKPNDSIRLFQKTNTTNKLLVFTNTGNYIVVPVHKIKEAKWKEIGQHISDFVPLENNENIVSSILIESFNINAYLVLITKMGMGKKVKLIDFEISRLSKASKAISLKKPNDQLVDVKVSNGLDNLLIATNTSHCIKVPETKIPILNPRASGNCLIKVEDNWVTAFGLAKENESLLLKFGTNNYKIIDFSLIGLTQNSNLSSARGKKIFEGLKAKNFISQICKNQAMNLLCSNDQDLELIAYSPKKATNSLEPVFSKFSSAKTSHIEFNINFELTKDNEQFSLQTNNVENDATVESASSNINSAFETIDKKTDEVNLEEIEEMLKKLKI